MKYLNKIVLSAAALMIPFAACDTDTLQEYNLNPQALNEVNMNFVFNGVLLDAATNGMSGDNWYLNGRTNLGYMSYFIQQMATTGIGLNYAGDKYVDNEEGWTAPWDFWYGSMVKNMRAIFKETGPGGFEEGRRKNTVAATKILWVLTFHRLTDFYGNVPYTEAGLGTAGVFFPKYDRQRDIYLDLLQKLEEAANELSASNPDDGFAGTDFVYNGDLAKWRKFAYSLMLRLAMRMSNVDAATAGAWVTKAIQGGTMTSNDDNFVVNFQLGPSIWVNQNGLSRQFIDGSHERTLSKTLVDFLKGANPNDAADDDPRLFIFSDGFDGNTNPLDQKGMPNGLDQGQLDELMGGQTIARETFSQIHVKLLDLDEPYVVMNAAESYFLKAEALVRGIGSGISGTAQSNYEEGVLSSMTMWDVHDESFEVSPAQVAAYLALNPYDPAKGLEMIYTQLWASKFMNWWEAWADWRRTGHPVLVPTSHPSSATPGVIPRRLRYPIRESATNQDNLQAGGSLPDSPEQRVWWDGGN